MKLNINNIVKYAGIVLIAFSSSLHAANILSMTSGQLKLSIDDKGKIDELIDISTGKNYISKRGDSWLMRIQKWNGKVNPKKEPMLNPVSAKTIKKNENEAIIELTYKNGEKVKISILKKRNYFTMKLIDATPLKDITKVMWGHYFTAMCEPIGMYIGINRSKDFSIGLLSLEMNTDGTGWDHTFAAGFDRGGSTLAQEAYDRSQPRALRRQCEYIISTPIKGLTVKGSKVALFGVKRGRKPELDIIEKIEIAEKLPHPMFKGKWTKRSKEMKSPCLWMSVNEKNIDKVLSLSKDFAGGSVCQFHGFFKNWGHFDIDEKDFPTGITGLKAVSDKCNNAGIHNTTYTLTTFLKPHPKIEPFIAPVPDNRLAYLRIDTKLSLAEPIDDKSNSMKLKLSNGLTEELKKILGQYRKVVRIDNEMIEFESWKKVGKNILLCEKLKRGGWLTTKAAHKSRSKAKYMYVSGYNNFYPGDQEMNMEVAENIGKISRDGEIGKIILDGYESILISGDCSYGRNTFIQRLYDMTRKNEALFSGSNLGNYSWHIMSFMSWGEFDKDKGFRGTMIEIRLKYQARLINSLIPNKLGQYYPDNNTSIEDIEWLCNQIAGWDSGVDLCMDYNNVHQNPNYDKLTATFRLWEEARIKQVFDENQKLNLRDTTSVYRLTKTPNGEYKLKFIRHWIDGRAKVVPSSAIKVTPINGGPASVKPCSVDWKMTHNPAVYSRICLSDDLICKADGKNFTEWKIKLPSPVDKRVNKANLFRCVIRLADNAKCGVTDITLKCNGQKLGITHVKLQPGEYLAIPHNNQYAYVYDAKTDLVKREIFIYQDNPYWYLPTIRKGEENKIELKCNSLKAGETPEILLNIQMHDAYFPPK